MFNPRSDLAIEAAAVFNKGAEEIKKLDGVDYLSEKQGASVVTKIKILNKNGESAIGKKIGTYVTIECSKISDGDESSMLEAQKIFSKELFEIIGFDKNKTVLVVGLGNWNVTPDALGPKVVSKLEVTRHLTEFAKDKNFAPLCAIAPGVLGITGMETGEIVKGICDKIKPDAVIAIDALATRKIDRISTSIQIADTGITPGSGIGNKRLGLNKEYLGIPVVAVGVPTVVDAATVANDTIEILSEIMKNAENNKIGRLLEVIDNDMRYSLIKEVLKPYVGDLIVTPKEIDKIIDDISLVIANGINSVFCREKA